ncbi:hypothetical protein ACCUM_3988 [Candidatus Accumulibacter phosphatis]|uniref:Uncharacterized protein n=1 Tax=Candidatus Accumulibacter phosphatis TaxID=327160 RepID=A0A5S4EMU2_9PROT|nr:hypothetical protein ACCUM_3988 [Candidatus Accumulibacter phosphatis]
MFSAGVGGLDDFAVVEVVVLVHAVEEEDSRFGVVVGGFHHLVPEVAGAHAAVHPDAVFALEGTVALHVQAGLGAVRQFDFAIGFDGLHESVGDGDRDVEVGEVAMVLGVDEDLDIRMVAAQHPHLRSTAGAGGFDGLARAVENAHIGYRTGGTRLRALDQRADRADRREVVTDATTPPHGFGGFGQGTVDAGLAIDDFDHRIADRLHEAVDQGRRERRAGGRVDASGRHEAVLLRPQEARFPVRALLFFLGSGKGTGNAAAHVVNREFMALGIFFDEYFGGDFLFGEWHDRGSFGDFGQGKLMYELAHGSSSIGWMQRNGCGWPAPAGSTRCG